MRNIITSVITAYLFIGAFALVIGNMTRLADKANCYVTVADYIFLGLTRLPCEVR